MLTIKQVAERLQISANTVYRLVQKGRISSFRIGDQGGAIRVSEEDLASFIESCRQERRPADRRTRPQPATKLKHIRLSS